MFRQSIYSAVSIVTLPKLFSNNIIRLLLLLLQYIHVALHIEIHTSSMADRYIPNKYPDFSETSKSDYLEDGHIKADLITGADRVLNALFMRLNRNVYGFHGDSDYSVYTGYTGIAFLYFFHYKQTNSSQSFDTAKYLIDKALSNLKGKDISFLLGDAGPLAIAALIYNKENKDDEVEKLIDRLIKLPEKIKSCPDELLYGRAGYIFALLFVNNYFGYMIPTKHIKKQLNYLLNSGRQKANKENASCPLKYEWHNENYFGAAHGLAGILYILLLNSDLLTQETRDFIIKPSLDWLILQRFPSGNFPSSEGSKTDKLVQWCHGAPGFVNLLTLAREVYRDEKYMDIALECGDLVWNRGILAKGYSMCHGVSGNAYTFVHLYQKTRELKHLHRLACFLDWCNKYPKNEAMQPDRPFSMFEGISGLAYFLIDVQDPMNAAFPAYSLN